MMADYVGIPYKNLGRSRDGCDCYGLAWLYHLEQFGVLLPSYLTGYASADDGGAVVVFGATIKHQWQPVPQPDLARGDLVTLRVGRYISHVGIWLDRADEFLHVLRGRNATIERLSDLQWQNSYQGAYRWTGA
jgi:cell wall-associated NlpC family hydrolase